MTVICLGLSPALDLTYVVDVVHLGAIHRPGDALRRPGGKSLNVARALRALGTLVQPIAPLGGRVGGLVADLLHDDGVQAQVVAGPDTRTCTTIVDGAGRATEFYPATPALEVEHWAAIGGALGAAPAGPLVLSGSIPGGFGAELRDALSARRGDLVLDIHGPALPELTVTMRPLLVKVNRHEALAATGEREPGAQARALVALGAEAAVVTDGTAGFAAARRDTPEVRRVPHLGGVGAYPTGSGDAFLAGLVHAWSSGLDAALEVAAACARANAAIPCAGDLDPGILERAGVSRPR